MTTRITRTKLYELVWSKPVTKVAADFDISDVALKKICRKHEIPTPPLSYWARVAAGQEPKRVSLPKISSPYLEEISIYGGYKMPEAVKEVLEAERQKIQISASPTSQPAELHPSIRSTAQALRKDKSKGTIRIAGNGRCEVIVGHDSVERAISVLNSIAYALGRLGHKLKPKEEKLAVTIGQDSVSFSLKERIERKKHVPTAEELIEDEKYQKKRARDFQRGIWDFDKVRAYPEFDYTHTGELGIHIDNEYVGGVRRSWNDGKTRKLEDMIDDIAVGLLAYAAGIKNRREEHDRWQENWKRRERLQALAKQRQEREEKRIAFVSGLMEKAAEVEKLKDFLLRSQSEQTDSEDWHHMIGWVKDRISMLTKQITPDTVAETLKLNGLFPTHDDLQPDEGLGA